MKENDFITEMKEKSIQQNAEVINNIASQNIYSFYAKGILPFRDSPYLLRIRELYDQKIEFFTESEISQTDKIIQTLKNDVAPFALVIGNPASGKSVLAFNIAQRIENNEKNFKSYYYTCREDLSPSDLINDIRFYNQTNRENRKLVIIDDIHLSLARVYYFFNRVKSENLNCAILFISRIMQNDFKDEGMDKDIYEELKSVTFELEFSLDKKNTNLTHSINEKVKTNQKSMNKIKGIIENFSHKNGLQLPSNDTIDDLFNKTGFDLLNLSYYLSAWKEKATKDSNTELQFIEESDVFKHIYSENLLKRLPKERDIIIKYACMYQYEVWFEIEYDDYQIIQQLMQDGLVVRENKIYSFYHSKFAELLVRSYILCDEFADIMYKEFDDLITFNLCGYIESYLNNRARKYPKNIFELFDGMLGGRNRYLHNDKDKSIIIFNRLLENSDVRDIILNFFYESDIEAMKIWKFLKFVSEYASQFHNEFEKTLIYTKDYTWIKEKIIKTSSVDNFLAFVLFTNTYPNIFYVFTNTEIKELILNSDYHSLKNLYDLKDDEIRTNIKALLTDSEWFLLLKDSEIDKIKDTLIFIEKLDHKFAVYLLNQFSDDDIYDKIISNFILGITSIMPIMKKIDSQRIKRILVKFDDEFIIDSVMDYLTVYSDETNILVISDFIQMMNEVDSEKTVLILSYIEFEKISSILCNYELQQIISFFSKIKEIDIKIASNLFDGFSLEFLCEKIKKVNANKILNLISEIKYLNEDTARYLMYFTKEILIKLIPEIKLETFLSYEKRGIIVIESEITCEIMGRLPDEYIRNFYNLSDMRDITRLISLYRNVDFNTWDKTYLLNEIFEYVDKNFGEKYLHKKWLFSTMQLLQMCTFFNRKIKSIGDKKNKETFKEILLTKGNLIHFAKNISTIKTQNSELAFELQLELASQLNTINNQMKGTGIFMNTILMEILKFIGASVGSGVTWDILKRSSCNIIERFKKKFVEENYFDSEENCEEFLHTLCEHDSLNEEEPFDDVRTLYKKYAKGKSYDLFEPFFKKWLKENATDIVISNNENLGISVFSNSSVEQIAQTINNIGVQHNY